LIFLFQFNKKANGIDFVLNEGIAADMYPEYEAMLRPLVLSTCQILTLYKGYSKSDTIMTGTILDSNGLEVMLSEGLGGHIDSYTKHQIIFGNAKLIADILTEVMNRRTLENRKYIKRNP
jgi:hypothetical protein